MVSHSVTAFRGVCWCINGLMTQKRQKLITCSLIDKLTEIKAKFTINKWNQWQQNNNKTPHDDTRAKTTSQMTYWVSHSLWFINLEKGSRNISRQQSIDSNKTMVNNAIKVWLNDSNMGRFVSFFFTGIFDEGLPQNYGNNNCAQPRWDFHRKTTQLVRHLIVS